jgi:hypothetical protein
MEIVITPSKNNNKKFDALIDGKKTVSFGQKGASDYTKHKDKERKERYIARHKKNEDHGLSGVKTAGFWSANLLWNKKTLKESVDDINKRFKSLNVKMK